MPVPNKKSVDLPINSRSIWFDFSLLVILFSLVAVWANWSWFTNDYFLPPYSPDHLGYEYYNIAESLAEGRGFSDPFFDNTGPTGWCSPMLPFLLSLPISIGLSRGEIGVIFLGFQVLVLAMTGTIGLHFGDKLKCRRLVQLSLLVAFVPNFSWLFQRTHDCVFLVFWVNAILLILWKHRTPPRSFLKKVLIGTLGGLSAMASPAVGFAWAACILVRWRQELASLMIVAITSILVVSPWIVHQSVRLEKFVPIKSNVGYELFQSQIILEDGLISEHFQFHPYWPSSKEGKIYRQLGETQYLTEKSSKAKAAVLSNPSGYCRKLSARFLAATILFHSQFPATEKTVGFKMTCAIAVIPFVGFLCLLFSKVHRKSNWRTPVLCMYVFYLLPYVIVSYYERYAVPIVLVKTILTLYLFSVIWELSKGILVKVSKTDGRNLGSDGP